MAEAATEHTSPDAKWSIDDAGRYLTCVVGLQDDLSVYELTEKLAQGRLGMHWRRTDRDGKGEEGDIPTVSWRSGALCLGRDHNTNEQHAPCDFATGTVTAQNDGRVFVQQLKSSIRATYELTVSARDVRMLWPEPARLLAQSEPRNASVPKPTMAEPTPEFESSSDSVGTKPDMIKTDTERESAPPKVGRPLKEDAWAMVDAQVRGKTFKGPSACAQAVYKELSKHRDGKKKEGRTFDLPAQGSIRNYVSNNAERLDITWQSKQPKDCTK